MTLDEAWKEAEAAAGEGVLALKRHTGDTSAARYRASFYSDYKLVDEKADTPAAALLALAERLRSEPKEPRDG